MCQNVHINALSIIRHFQKINPAKDKAAIIKVIQEEWDAFAANDLDRIAALYIQDSTTRRIEQGPDYYPLYAGWDQSKKLYQDWIKGNSTDSAWKNPQNLKANIIVKVVGNAAWVVCENTWKWEFNAVKGENTNVQIAFLEKVNGQWKISFHGFLAKPVPKAVAEVAK